MFLKSLEERFIRTKYVDAVSLMTSNQILIGAEN
jgi:hypothetical protein